MSFSGPLLRRAVLVLALVTLLLAGVTRVDHQAEAVRTPAVRAVEHRPNVVMVMADDMRADDLRFMPQVRRLLVQRGLTFRNSFSPYPLCCPARASFLTGRFAHNHKVYSHEQPWGFGSFDDHATLAGSLQRAGYRTAFVGKYLNGYGSAPSRVTGGPSFRYVPPGWTDWYGAVERPPLSGYGAGGTYNYWHTLFNVNGRIDDTHAGQYQTRVLGRYARDLVHAYAGRRPFFLYFSAVAPHFGKAEKGDPLPVRRSDGGLTKFQTPGRPKSVRGAFDATVTRPPGLPVGGGPSEADMSDKPRGMRSMPELNRREVRALTALTRQRAEALLVLDQEVGRLVRSLRRSGELDDTVLMFTSDNGYFLGEHRQRTGKIKAHEPSLRVPFVLAGPGVPQGERFDPITTEDVTATIADLAGATPYLPYPPDGSSRVPTIVGGDRGWTEPVLTEGVIGGHGHRTARQRQRGFHDARNTIGIRTARYSYIRYVSGATELYDLDRDPNQMHSVLEDPAYADVRRTMRALWTRTKDCAGAGCRQELPPELQRGPEELALQTRLQARGVQARSGTRW